jgi:hypothetical protein
MGRFGGYLFLFSRKEYRRWEVCYIEFAWSLGISFYLKTGTEPVYETIYVLLYEDKARKLE